MTQSMVHFFPGARLGLVIPLALLSGLCMAQPPDTRGYLLDGVGGFVGSTTPGQCWQNGAWTPALAVAPCDAVLMAAAPVVPPAPAAEKPAAAAPVVVAPVLMPLPAQRLNFSADTLFAFDKSVLSPTGMGMLDDLTKEVSGSTFDAIHVRGYTDRIGTAAYNQKLSIRRATVVSDYLVSKGVAADRIDTHGEGESHPMTTLAECPGGKRAVLIECLRRDRRVEVDVQGTKAATR